MQSDIVLALVVSKNAQKRFSRNPFFIASRLVPPCWIMMQEVLLLQRTVGRAAESIGKKIDGNKGPANPITCTSWSPAAHCCYVPAIKTIRRIDLLHHGRLRLDVRVVRRAPD
eukprot:5811643-Pleurochrysis_carterae.AAC.1